VMGSSSEFNSRLALVKLCQLLNATIPGINCRVRRFEVVNRVASVCIGKSLDVEKLARDWKFLGLWERTSFPGFKLVSPITQTRIMQRPSPSHLPLSGPQRCTDLSCTFVIFPKGISRHPSTFRAISSQSPGSNPSLYLCV
jgi:hypothetical protein